MKNKLKNNFVIILLTFAIPGIIAFLLKDSFSSYKDLVQPKFAPPSIVFPIAWNILYLLMSIAFIIVKNDDDNLKIYYFQLLLNALWSPIFFGLKNYFLALVELVILLVIIIYMTYKFYKDNKITIYFLIPYILWLLFALYLNYFVMIYN
jgi:tryptophan-rich sensory protein